MFRKSLTAALLISVAASAVPATSYAGVMPVTDNASVSLSTTTTQVDWRAYPHRHRRWHMGWHYGWPRYRYGMYAGWNPANAPGVYGYAAPAAAYGAAYPSCGVYGAAYPTCGGCGTYGYGGGLFGMGLGIF